MTSRSIASPVRRRRRVWSRMEQMGHNRPRCTVASLRAMGCEPIALPESIHASVSELRAQGYIVEKVEVDRGETCWSDSAWRYTTTGATTLGQFVKAHPTGTWAIFTPGHMLAIIDGVIIDTAGRGMARRVERAFRVTRDPSTSMPAFASEYVARWRIN